MSREWTADEVLATARGFQEACLIVAAAELDVFTLLRSRPMGAAELAKRIRGDQRATAVLLDALAALGLLVKRKGRYSVPPTAGELLAETGSRCCLGMVRHLGNCLRRWSQLARVVRTGKPARPAPSVRGEAEDLAAFIRAMNEVSAPLAPLVVRSLQPLSFEHLLDLGGGSGTWTIAFLRAAPRARATIFDLPAVIPMARRRTRDAGLSRRVRLVGGDFFKDDLPGGADLAWVSAIVHQNSRPQNRAMFTRLFDALAVGGRVMVRDVIVDESRTRPPAGALFAVNMLVATRGGGTYTFDELREDLQAAGFADVKWVRRGESMDSVLCATKPE